jgi:hypothetical protein
MLVGPGVFSPSSLRGLLDSLDGFGDVDVLTVFSQDGEIEAAYGALSVSSAARSEDSREGKPSPASPMQFPTHGPWHQVGAFWSRLNHPGALALDRAQL